MRISADWLNAAPTRNVIGALEAVQSDSTRFVGGCVRNSIMGRPVDDIDLATQLIPTQTIAALEAAGIRAIPTGLDHGTVTAVCDSTPFEITTLRRDVATDGRRAVVAFSADWAEDAQRRDFRLNALYANAQGDVYDPTGSGVSDAQSGQVIFIGEPDARLKEDFLRILRFFRFNAWYGQTLDRQGLAACERNASGLNSIARERKWRELAKLFAAPSPVVATSAMADIGLLKVLLGGDARTPDRLNRLVDVETSCDFAPDPLRRLMTLLPRNETAIQRASDALRLSNKELGRLRRWSDPDLPDFRDSAGRALFSGLYRYGATAVLDRGISAAVDEGAFLTRDFLEACASWRAPAFPVKGDDALAAGLKGAEIGQALRKIEQVWVESGFSLDREELLALLNP